MSKTYTFFDAATGLFNRKILKLPGRHTAADLALNTPDGFVAIEGVYDPLCQRVYHGLVVEYQPEQPSDDHVWNDEKKRWLLKPDVALTQGKRERSIRAIEALEQKQLRPLRELQINPDNREAKRRLEEIERAIERYRGGLQF